MDIFLYQRIVIILFALSTSCVCFSNERILDQLSLIENRLNEENRLRRTDTIYILSKLDEMETRFQKAIVGLSTITNDETLEKDKLLFERMEHQNRDSSPGDEVLLRAFREEKLVNSRTRKQVQTLGNTVTKLESEREGMNAVIKEMFTTLKTFKTEMTLANSEIKYSLNNINVQVQSIAEKNTNLEDIIIKVNSTVSQFKSTTLEVLPAVQKVSENTKTLVENVSAAVATNKEKIQNVETSISVLSEHPRNQCNTSAMDYLSWKVNTIYNNFLPLSCSEAGDKKNGIYRVKPNFLESAMEVYCDMVSDEGGWTVFQRRQDGSVNFYQGWEKYKNGFGDVSGEYWMGNELLHEFTNSRPTELWIDLVDMDGNKGYARYSSFSIGSEDEDYILSISGYSGDVGDSLAFHNNRRFSTKDRDNAPWYSKCEVLHKLHKAAWWHNSCLYCNLNGAYRTGVMWYYWHNNHDSMQFTEMKFRWKS